MNVGAPPYRRPMLTETQQQILTLERQRWKFAGVKEQVIRDELGISATVYYARLNALLDDPAALATDPLLVRRLSRLRDARRRRRVGVL